MDLFYLPLYLYCEFADIAPSTVRMRQFGIYFDSNIDRRGTSILELNRSQHACSLYIYASDDLFLDGDWFVVFESINYGSHDGVYVARPRFNEKNFNGVSAPLSFEAELTKMLDWYGELRQEMDAT